MNEKQSLQSEKHLIAGSRTYHFGIQLSGDASRSLVVDEVQADQHNRIMVVEEHWDEFMASLTQVLTSKTQAIETAIQPNHEAVLRTFMYQAQQHQLQRLSCKPVNSEQRTVKSEQ
jgi:hypothetical protein